MTYSGDTTHKRRSYGKNTEWMFRDAGRQTGTFRPSTSTAAVVRSKQYARTRIQFGHRWVARQIPFNASPAACPPSDVRPVGPGGKRVGRGAERALPGAEHKIQD